MGHDRAAYMGRVPRGGGLNIAIDARWIFDEISGIGAYTRELIGALAIIDRDNAYMLYFTSEAIRDRTYREAGLSENKNLKSRIVPFGWFSCWTTSLSDSSSSIGKRGAARRLISVLASRGRIR